MSSTPLKLNWVSMSVSSVRRDPGWLFFSTRAYLVSSDVNWKPLQRGTITLYGVGALGVHDQMLQDGMGSHERRRVTCSKRWRPATTQQQQPAREQQPNIAGRSVRGRALVAAVALVAQREEGDEGEVGVVAAAGLLRRLLLEAARGRARTPDARCLRRARGLVSRRDAGTCMLRARPVGMQSGPQP